jgi:serine/threonine protein kinase
VKILKKHVATDEFVARFEREVQLASQLLHPNTVEIYDFGRTREGAPYYVMEYLDGVTLAQLVEYSGPVPAARAIHILRQVCAALREAHLRGIVHRDVKPENVMLCRRGEDDVVKLVDFGLMKNLSRPDTRDLTKQLKVLGTPRYMAPERIANPADVDARSDLYAVGAVGYLLLTGKPIFPGDNDMEITHQVVHAPPPRPSEAAPFGVPPVLDDLLHDCLAKDRAKRPQTAEAMMEILGQLAARHPWAQRDAGAWWRRYRSEHTDAASAEHAKKGR